MPIEKLDCDAGRGSLVLSRRIVTDQELIDFWSCHLTHDKEKSKSYKYKFGIDDLTFS